MVKRALVAPVEQALLAQRVSSALIDETPDCWHRLTSFEALMAKGYRRPGCKGEQAR